MLLNSLLWIYFRKRGDAYLLAVKHSLGGLNAAWCCTGLCTLLTGAAVSNTLISAASLPVTRCSDAVCTALHAAGHWASSSSASRGLGTHVAWLRPSFFPVWFFSCQAQWQGAGPGAASQARRAKSLCKEWQQGRDACRGWGIGAGRDDVGPGGTETIIWDVERK